MNKIVSNFYLIRLDGEPVYVGYTNRTIKQRFSEHKKDKDFGDIEPTVESLGNLKYDFTWDMGLINQYAREVSDRETELVEEYGTQDSVWQKGASGNIGGQTWANVKYFIKTNRDNPAFRKIDDSDIMILLEWQQRNSKKLRGMINDTNIKGSQKLRNMIKNTNIKGAQKLESMVNTTNIKGFTKTKNMITQTNINGFMKLRNMVNNTNIKGSKKLKDMVKNTNIKGSIKLESMVNHTNIKGAQKLNNMVNHTDIKGAQKLRDMVNHTKEKS